MWKYLLGAAITTLLLAPLPAYAGWLGTPRVTTGFYYPVYPTYVTSYPYWTNYYYSYPTTYYYSATAPVATTYRYYAAPAPVFTNYYYTSAPAVYRSAYYYPASTQMVVP
jgi:hypothetical protein